MIALEFRDEQPGDSEPLAGLHRAAFGSHGEKVAALVAALRAAVPECDLRSVVALDRNEYVGHVMVTRCWIDAERELVRARLLSPLAVAPRRQRAGIGRALVTRALERAAAEDAPALFLEGDPAYYGRLGFDPADRHGFRRPSLRIPAPAFQVAILPAHEDWMTGTVVYSEPFWLHDAVGRRDTT